jgi:peptidoglycan/xylan/chitin deacetylase (PgdA/CDA1 family)
MKKIFYYLLVSLIFLFCNCQKEKAAIAFTFDDCYIDEWYSYRSLFQKYNIHATFFITRPHLLDSSQIHKLKILASEGHEIACHGYQHKNVLEYQSEDYINQEVVPALQKMREIGFEPAAFAYPFGASTAEMDSILLNYFKIVRKATYNIRDTTIDQYPEIYANSNNYRIVNAMGIDYNFSISPENFETGIKRALKNKEILIVYAHLMDNSNGDYTIDPEYLEKLFLICQKNQIKSKTMSELEIKN